VLIASITFDVRPSKRAEFLSGVRQILEAVRWAPGCLGCRLLSDCEDLNAFVITSEWDSREFLEKHLASAEFHILEGTRYLLERGPRLSVDEVIPSGREQLGPKS
jgi:quinol monooxygenase YgiN